MSPRDWLQFRQKKHASKYKYTSSWYVLRLGGCPANKHKTNFCQGQFVRDVGAARWKANASAMSLKRGGLSAGQGRAARREQMLSLQQDLITPAVLSRAGWMST